MLTNQKLCFKICCLGSCWRSWRNNSWFLWGCFQSRWPIYPWAWISRSISSVEQCCLWGRSVWLYSFGIQWKYLMKLGSTEQLHKGRLPAKIAGKSTIFSWLCSSVQSVSERHRFGSRRSLPFFRQSPFLQSTCENHYLLYYLLFSLIYSARQDGSLV